MGQLFWQMNAQTLEICISFSMQKLYGPCITFQYEKAIMFLGVDIGHKNCKVSLMKQTRK